MTGTYQVLDGDKGPEYGTPFSPTSGETIETNDLGNSNDLGESSPRSRSPELSLPSENGLAENEHVSTEKETSSASMFLIFVVYYIYKLCHEKTNKVVLEQVKHNASCTSTEAG